MTSKITLDKKVSVRFVDMDGVLTEAVYDLDSLGDLIAWKLARGVYNKMQLGVLPEETILVDPLEAERINLARGRLEAEARDKLPEYSKRVA